MRNEIKESTIREIMIYFFILILVDSIWLKIIGKKYQNMISKIQKSPLKPKYQYAFIVYFVIAFALYYFTKDCKNINCKISNAFVTGITSYAIYDFTNAALLKDWDIFLAIMDTLWGGIVFVIVVYIRDKIKI